MTLAVCTENQKPFSVVDPYDQSSIGTGDTAGNACSAALTNARQSADYSLHLSSDSMCQISYFGSVQRPWPIVKVCEVPTKNPFVLSVADGSILAGAVLVVWAAAFAVKQLSRVVLLDAGSEN